MIFDINGCALNQIFNTDGKSENYGYDMAEAVYPDLPIPSGSLTASEQIPLPDIYSNGHGWTCTGLAFDRDSFLVGDIGKELPSSSGFASKIIRVSADFSEVIEQIDLYSKYPNMQDIQGICVENDGTIWFCSPNEKLVRHIDRNGNSIGSFSTTPQQPTGVAYSPTDDTFWVLTYSNSILKVNRSGSVLETYSFAYSDTLDQCFFDYEHGYLYITAGANYTGINNLYMFDVSTHQQSIVCTLDSYSVEGIWIGAEKMVIVNDGYYHSALVPVNQANIYTLQ